MEALIDRYLDNPLILTALLFVATFVLEEAAILLAAGLAAGDALRPPVALAAVWLGVVVSDWSLYALGALAGRSRRIRAWVPQAQLDRGRGLLARSTLLAGLLARLIPWLLFPVFVASGFLRTGFRRFALVNLAIATIYVGALFFGAIELYEALTARMGHWAWAVGAGLLLVILWGGRRIAARYFPADRSRGA